MGKKIILIADDEPDTRLLVSNMLAKYYTVLGASDGQEAINLARSQKPDLILMDIIMPKLDGYTACYAIKADKAIKATPVVMLTGIRPELNKKLGKRLGSSGYIVKPFSLQDLLDTIGQFLRTS